ncbi:hypothetical protein RHGRI_038916 [Rhododendron griersonianum]|uniref:Uncharacterized protein n=1 Tax=Rhododendron griersonianum TaxID=479676 RepID=A0AAV6HHQ0_9ERIC|nr:hypothetical protein RHGRI_038916 [Rhododendron griersonianum]
MFIKLGYLNKEGDSPNGATSALPTEPTANHAEDMFVMVAQPSVLPTSPTDETNQHFSLPNVEDSTVLYFVVLSSICVALQLAATAAAVCCCSGCYFGYCSFILCHVLETFALLFPSPRTESCWVVRTLCFHESSGMRLEGDLFKDLVGSAYYVAPEDCVEVMELRLIYGVLDLAIGNFFELYLTRRVYEQRRRNSFNSYIDVYFLLLVSDHQNEEHSCKGPSENQIKLHSDQVKADWYSKFQAEESDEATCMPSNSALHEWGQSNLMDTIPRAGSSSSQAFSS